MQYSLSSSLGWSPQLLLQMLACLLASSSRSNEVREYGLTDKPICGFAFANGLDTGATCTV